ncbi:MAG: mobile mystery protein A [Fibrobacter sp.]|nr:mobile mystery protein A [Fibrobacter sp.]
MGNLAQLRDAKPPKQGWISTVRQALGMTAKQLAERVGLSQPRIAKMELNEKNLKISTMKKIAEGLDCEFVYGFVPKSSLQETIKRQAYKKAEAILLNVNTTMALEDQLADDPHILTDMADEMIAKNIKRIWDK